MARKLLCRVVRQARRSGLVSNEHFTVDGTLIESWAVVKSVPQRDGDDGPSGPRRSPAVDFHGERRTNGTHVAGRDPEAKLYRNAQSVPAKLHYLGHVLMVYRTGLPVDVEVTEVNGFAEREAALTMLDWLPKRVRRKLAADKAYDTAAREARHAMGAPRAMPATSPASGCASGSRRSSAGARTAGRCAR